MSFHRARVLAFESRRAKEIAELIRLNEGEPFVAPALIEVPLTENAEALSFADRLYRGEIDMVVFLTGVGVRLLGRVIALRDGEERFSEALRQLTIVSRGPKPAAVLREWNVPIAVNVPEPNTWRELLQAIESCAGRMVAVQEYGRSNPELHEGLLAQGRTVLTVPVYQWALPSDTEPMSLALSALIEGQFQSVLFTNGVQIEHFLEFAEGRGKRTAALRALQHVFVGSIGPTCSEALQECGITPAMEPSHPKMGILVREAAMAYAKRHA